jgi:subtilisin family serine protease
MLAFLAASCTEGPAGVDDGAPSVGAPSFSESSVANTYLLTAGKWNQEQTDAVEAAGGNVTFSHRASGIGIAASDDPDFLDKVLASGLISAGQADEMVEWQPNTQVAEEVSVTPGDETFYLMQWSLDAIDAPEAWAAGYDGSGARVAVIDGGVNDTHLDLSGQVDVACSNSFVPGQPFNYDLGGFWHGSHVAGIIAAADNGVGTIGVAPGATIPSSRLRPPASHVALAPNPSGSC